MQDGLTELLQQREMSVEAQINRYRGVLGAAVLVADWSLAISLGSFTQLVPFLIGFVVLFAGYVYAVQRIATGPVYRPWLKYVTITADVALLSAYFVEVQFSSAMGEEIDPQVHTATYVLVLLIVLVLSSLRFSQPAVVYAGALTALAGTAFSALLARSAVLTLFAGAAIALCCLLIYAGARGYRRLIAQWNQREALTRFLPREMVERVDSGEFSLSLGGEEKQVTLLLCDIRGFTTLSESTTPVAVVALLNAYLSRMTEIIFHYGGTLDKFMGDGILAVFGSPVSRTDDPQRAMQAALHMLAAVPELNAEIAAAGHPPLRIGIALHTGPVVAGNIGSPHRMEFTVIGDSVNMVARIEALNKTYGTSLLLSEETHRLVADLYAGEAIAETTLRGRQHTTRLYGLRQAAR